MRTLKGIKNPLPVPNDRVICCRNNNPKGLLNGQMWSVINVKPKGRNTIDMHLRPDDDEARAAEALVHTHEDFFAGDVSEMPWSQRRNFDEFDYGYAITCHKAQGSQWNSVYLFDESHSFRDERDKWLYTAVTRAAERITVVA
jgi:exodeoxyribonuclease-5